jgi:site-specific recombinase XerD
VTDSTPGTRLTAEALAGKPSTRAKAAVPFVSQAQWCLKCGLKPQGYSNRLWCYDCKPGSKGRPLPCRRCGSRQDYWTSGLCRRCHQYAPQLPQSCRDCLAWGVQRTQKWLCHACLSWRILHPTQRSCVTCAEHRAVNEHHVCRLCWRHIKLVQEGPKRRPRGPLNIDRATRGGVQLSFANMGSTKQGYRPPPRPPQQVPSAPPTAPDSHGQLDLFTPDPIEQAVRRLAVPEPPSIRLAQRLDRITCEHAAAHGWSQSKTDRIRIGMRVLLGHHQLRDVPVLASQVNALRLFDQSVTPLLAVLATAGLLEDDRLDRTQAWFRTKTQDLPTDMTAELQIWFDVLYYGSRTSPRSRPRAAGTLVNRMTWTLPTLHLWAAAGHTSLREISQADVLAVLPTAGNPRVKLGAGLRSIFTTLKAKKVIFVNPMSRIQVGNFERRSPLPADPERLQRLLDTTDPAGAVLASLMVFHGLRPRELRDLQLTDIYDQRLHLPDRTIPLAEHALTRLATYLAERARRWPASINPHLFIHPLNAGGTHSTSREWVNAHLGTSAWAIREHRIVDETLATAGDLRRICDFFGVTMATAQHYATALNHAAFNEDHPEPSPVPGTPAPR